MTGDVPDERSAEERAEALMERVTSRTSRFVTRALGRTREELEDMLAEARTISRGDEPPSGRRGRTRSSG
jgi:hypothetical protein